MELADVLRQMSEEGMNAAQLTDLRIGTVASADPLQIICNPAMPPLEAGVLYLTSAVTERKIPVLFHNHTISAGKTETAEAHVHDIPEKETGFSLDNLSVLENGRPLPVKDGYIILNRGLEAGDKVLMLRVMRGQRYIVLSHVMEAV